MSEAIGDVGKEKVSAHLNDKGQKSRRNLLFVSPSGKVGRRGKDSKS